MNLELHACGGVILSATHDGHHYYYCDECRAFVYDDADDTTMPTGINRQVNGAAWDAGELRSEDTQD